MKKIKTSILLLAICLSACSETKTTVSVFEEPLTKVESCVIEPQSQQNSSIQETDASHFPVVTKDEFPDNPVASDLSQLVEDKGLIGLIHGIDLETKLFVFSYHVPGNFFKRFNISLLAFDKETQEYLAQLNRGDRVYVKGTYSEKAGQPHLYLSELSLIKRYIPDGTSPAGEYERRMDIACVLKQKFQVTALVHAIGDGGKVLVLDYLNTVFPVFVSNPALTENLYRGDVVEIKVTPFAEGKAPSHFMLADNGLKVVDSILKNKDQQVTVEGRLTRFPESPTINRTIWAVEDKIEGVGSRYYTLVNFEMDADNKPVGLIRIDEMLSQVWNDHIEGSYLDRNKFVHLGLKVRATGTFSVFSKNQANAQLFTDTDQIEVKVVK